MAILLVESDSERRDKLRRALEVSALMVIVEDTRQGALDTYKRDPRRFQMVLVGSDGNGISREEFRQALLGMNKTIPKFYDYTAQAVVSNIVGEVRRQLRR